MANSVIVVVGIDGEEKAVKAALERLDGYRQYEDGGFWRESTWATRFDGIEAVSAGNPDVAITAAAVELGNRNAEAKVWFGGGVVGEYEMQEGELSDVAGPLGEENEVIDSLFSTVAAYAHDALNAHHYGALAASGPKA